MPQSELDKQNGKNVYLDLVIEQSADQIHIEWLLASDRLIYK